MGSSTQSDSNDADGEAPLETDPSNRFQRLNDVLGEGDAGGELGAGRRHPHLAGDRRRGREQVESDPEKDK